MYLHAPSLELGKIQSLYTRLNLIGHDSQSLFLLVMTPNLHFYWLWHLNFFLIGCIPLFKPTWAPTHSLKHFTKVFMQ